MVDHPGKKLKEIAKEICLQKELAKDLGLSKPTVNLIMNEHRNISVETALRLEKVLQVPTAREWMIMQIDYDIEQARMSKGVSLPKVY